jgi:hypothetical protein
LSSAGSAKRVSYASVTASIASASLKAIQSSLGRHQNFL